MGPGLYRAASSSLLRDITNLPMAALDPSSFHLRYIHNQGTGTGAGRGHIPSPMEFFGDGGGGSEGEGEGGVMSQPQQPSSSSSPSPHFSRYMAITLVEVMFVLSELAYWKLHR